MCGVRDELSELPKWVGELYLELHRGTLTSIAAIKRGNRKCEFALRDVEFTSTLAMLKSKSAYPTEPLDKAWKIVLLNHFHDILPGSAIAEVNDEALAEYSKCLTLTSEMLSHATQQLTRPSTSKVSIMNSLSWPRTEEFVLKGIAENSQPAGAVAQEFEDLDGLACLAVKGLTLPPMGYVSLSLEPIKAMVSAFVVTTNSVESPHALVWFDDSGSIKSFYDKVSRRELVTPGGAFNQLLMGEDVPAAWDNWDIDRDQRHKLAPAGTLRSSEVVSNGPLQLRIRRTYDLGKASTLIQDVVFHSSTSRVDFETKVDWHEKYQFLKVGFAVDVLAETALHEIQFGHVQRNSHDNTSQDRAQFDVCAHKWTDISENAFGVAFLNDCKYACTIKDGEYRLSLIKAGRHPDPRGDEGIHRFSYAILPHSGGFSVDSVVKPAYEFNVVPIVTLGEADQPEFSLIEVDSPNVIVAAVKKAEDSDDVIVRLYEAGKSGGYCRLNFGFPVVAAHEVDLLEENEDEIALEAGGIEIYFKPFEIKTLKLSPLRR